MHSDWTRRPSASPTYGGIFDQASIDDDLAAIDHDLQQPGFWDDPAASAGILQQRRALERRLETLNQLREDSAELEDTVLKDPGTIERTTFYLLFRDLLAYRAQEIDATELFARAHRRTDTPSSTTPVTTGP